SCTTSCLCLSHNGEISLQWFVSSPPKMMRVPSCSLCLCPSHNDEISQQ
ncbi:unnamed protein product, partial [Staurois parvus]